MCDFAGKFPAEFAFYSNHPLLAKSRVAGSDFNKKWMELSGVVTKRKESVEPKAKESRDCSPQPCVQWFNDDELRSAATAQSGSRPAFGGPA